MTRPTKPGLRAGFFIALKPVTGSDFLETFLVNRSLICIGPVNVFRKLAFVVQRVGSRTGGMPTVDQSDMRGLDTA